MEIITGHVNADFDCLAAMVAAQKIYTDARLVLVGSQNKNVREFISLHKDLLNIYDHRQLDKSEISRLILVDTRIAERLGELEDIAYKPALEIFAFDHHPPTKDDLKVTRDFSKITGATTTILVEMMQEKGVSISSFEATLFALGIHEDTGSLTYTTTTYNDVQALAYLLSKGVNTKAVNRFLTPPLTAMQKSLLDQLLEKATSESIDGMTVYFFTAKVKDYIDGASTIAHKLSDVENADVSFTILTINDRIHIIGRSRIDEIHVDEILAKFDGGGHPQAASAVAKNISPGKIKEALIEELRIHAKPSISAADVMSKLIKRIDVNTPLSEAERIMEKESVTRFLVSHKKKIIGSISRRDIEKAHYHGLMHAPVKGFMMSRVVEVSTRTPLEEIEQAMLEEDEGVVLVVEKEEIVGVITRSDLLRAICGHDYLPKIGSGKGFSRGEIIRRIKTLLPAEVQILLRDIGKVAQKEKISSYLVGGIVRDLILKWSNLDIDIVVEGDGISFAKALIKKLGGRICAHKKFGTAVVILLSGFHIDIASARTEHYKKPAALPEVEPSSVKSDLKRRDFSINAMAIALNTPRFGKLLDFFDSQKDLQDGVVRILHKKSFIEDPTRIFRAVRFEQRYKFKMDEETEKLAKKSIDQKIVKELTNVRVRDELVQILSEKTAWDALNRLSELGLLEVLHSNISVDAGLKNLYKQIEESIPQLDFYFSAPTRRWLVLLMALFRNVKGKEIKEWCERMKFKKKDAQILEQGVVRASDVLKRIEGSGKIKNSQLYSMLKPVFKESLVFMFAQAHAVGRRRINFYLANLKGVKPALTGDDLIGLGEKPSSHFGGILKSILLAKLDGGVKTRQEEIGLAKEMIKKPGKRKKGLSKR